MKQWWVPGLQIGYEHSFVHQVADFIQGLESGVAAAPTFEALEGRQLFATFAATEDGFVLQVSDGRSLRSARYPGLRRPHEAFVPRRVGHGLLSCLDLPLGDAELARDLLAGVTRRAVELSARDVPAM